MMVMMKVMMMVIMMPLMEHMMKHMMEVIPMDMTWVITMAMMKEVNI